MNCEHRRGYEHDWKNLKPCSLCESQGKVQVHDIPMPDQRSVTDQLKDVLSYSGNDDRRA